MILLLITSCLLIILGVTLTLANFIKWGAVIMAVGGLIAIFIKALKELEQKINKKERRAKVKVGDHVKTKINGVWYEGEIICVYAVPKDWDLVDIRLNNGDVARGVSTKDVFSV